MSGEGLGHVLGVSAARMKRVWAASRACLGHAWARGAHLGCVKACLGMPGPGGRICLGPGGASAWARGGHLGCASGGRPQHRGVPGAWLLRGLSSGREGPPGAVGSVSAVWLRWSGAARPRTGRELARALQILLSFPWSFGLRRSRPGFAPLARPRSQARPDTKLYKVPGAWFSGAARLRAPLGFCSVPCSGARPPLLLPRPFCSRAPSKSRR